MTRAYAAFEAAGAYWFTELTVMNPPRGRILRSRFTQNRRVTRRGKISNDKSASVQRSANRWVEAD